MKFLREIPTANLKGVKVLVRVDMNVPVSKGRVVDDYRIRKALPTLELLRKAGARSILVSHIETTDADGGPTLAPTVDRLKLLGVSCQFVKQYRDARPAIESMKDGEFVLLENLRVNEGEKKNDAGFAKELASLADLYVNEAFAVSHRAHASISAITEFIPAYAGLLFEQEVLNLSSAFHPDPVTGRPFLFILCGAKFETKIPLIEKFMKVADTVFVGGALANNFFKEKGMQIGGSLVSPASFDLKRFFDDPKLMLPIDAVTTSTLTSPVIAAQTKPLIISVNAIGSADVIMDAGPETVRALSEKIAAAKYILWNGPLGAYEMGYKQPTLALAHMISTATSRGAKTIVGGGDTLATIAELGIEHAFTFVSTAGGAMLDYLANETLPGIEALNRKE